MIDGLRGQAAGDEEALVTLEILAAFTDARVRDFVQRKKAHHAKVSLGTTATFDPDSMRRMPLAIDAKRQLVRFEKESNRALAHLIALIGPRDALCQQVLEALEVERPGPEHFELLREIVAFDGSARLRRALVGYLGELAAPTPAPRVSMPSPPAVEWTAGDIADVEAIYLERFAAIGPERPYWTAAAGDDRFGPWAELRIGKAAQRMRWIAPAQFLMGSPEGEAGRQGFEGPRHKVELTQGFWLAETPCTQALFQALMHRNPSQFVGARRPV